MCEAMLGFGHIKMTKMERQIIINEDRRAAFERLMV